MEKREKILVLIKELLIRLSSVQSLSGVRLFETS